MSNTMWKNGISKVVHNRELVAAKEAGWTYSPEQATVKPKKPIKAKILIDAVEVIKPIIQTTDFLGPEDFNQEGE